MAQSTIIFTEIEIKVNGTAIETLVLNALIEAVMDQHTHLPHMFTLRLHDPKQKLVDDGPFDLTKEVEISVINGEGNKVKLITGEITALEPEFQAGMVAVLVVRGYDKSHRLFRETKSEAFINTKDSDLAKQFAGSAGLSSQVDATSTVYDHIYQDNQSDLSFLMQRAWRIGYECFVADGKLYFRKPQTSGTKVALEWGKDMVSFNPVMTLAEQVDEVIVKGWDPETQKAIIGQAKSGKLYPKSGESKDGAKWSSTFGTGKQVIVDVPVITQAEADLLAQARLDELSGMFVEAEGVVLSKPQITAGEFVEIKGLGTRFSGTYMVTEASHLYDNTGLTTTFTVRGSRTGMLAEQMFRQEPLRRWNGVVTAVVTNSDDPDKNGRLKLKYPWMSDDAESDWARVVNIGNSPDAGLFMTHKVGDEVLVSFEHGDFNRPFVVGGLPSSTNSIPAAATGAADGEKHMIRLWQSHNGHYILMHDDTKDKMELATASGHTILMDDANKLLELTTAGGHKVTMDDQGKKLEIVSSGGHKITLDDMSKKVIINSSGDVELKSAMNMKIDAGGMLDITATGILSLKGKLVNIN